MTRPLVIAVGMNREARALRSSSRVVVGARNLAEALADDPIGVISFGLCGGLDLGLTPGDLLVGTAVCFDGGRIEADTAWAAKLVAELSAAASGAFAGSDGIVATARAKSALRDRTGAIAADMESHRVAGEAALAGVPFAIVRAVSDGADEDLPRAAQAGFRPDGRTDVAAVIRELFVHPGELPALIRTARNAGAGFRTLDRAAPALFAPVPV